MSVSTDGLLFWGVAYTDDELEQYWYEDDGAGDVEDKLEHLEEAHPDVVFGSHCSDGCELPYVAIDELHVRAYRGHPKDANDVVQKLINQDGTVWRDRLKAAVEDAGLPWEEPKLTLASWWG